MLVKTFSSAVHGVDANTITVEVNASGGGDPKYFMVGLPDNAVKESWHRIETALKNSYFRMPRLKIVINLAPADCPKGRLCVRPANGGWHFGSHRTNRKRRSR